MPRSHRSELVPFDSEPEKTFCARRNFWKEIRQAEDLITIDSAYVAFIAENPSLEKDTSTSAPTTIIATLASYSESTLASIPMGFKLPTTDDGTFEIRPSYINLVERNMFGGEAIEDPAKYMEKFVTYCCSIPLTAGVTQDEVKQVLFLFSLRDGAAEWLRDLDMETNAITDWNTLALAFYKRFQNNTTDASAWKLINEIATHTAEYGNPRGHNVAECMSTIEQQECSKSYSTAAARSEFVIYIIPQNRGNQPQGGYQRQNQGGQQMQFPQQTQNNDMSEIMAMLPQQITASQNQEALITQLMADNKMLDNQISQLSASSREPGTLPSQPEKPHDTANAIQLRSGLTYDGPEMSQVNDDLIIEELDVDTGGKFTDEDAVTPEKNKALCDLGGSVSVMPYSVCEKLNIGHLKVTNVTLQMTDRTVKRPLGVLEDAPVKIGKFFIPVDFIVLDMAEDTQIPIILGRPFLHIAWAIIDVKQGRLTLEVGDDKVIFNLASTLARPIYRGYMLCYRHFR
ncbi:uncharacterized protein LOC141601074 [Silene latifolia]|uniref:uncharacterized protein LOC141601074 n=1 Tax=Silene latifolia TaxID=37657 RepID=UPI003D7811F3